MDAGNLQNIPGAGAPAPAPQRSGDGPPQAGKKQEPEDSVHLTVGTYNIKDFIDERNPAINLPQKNGRPPVGPKSEKEQKAAAEMIRAMNADVVTLQEVQDMKILDKFVDTHLPGQYPYRALVDAHDPRGIDVACISKYPITNVVSHKDDRFPIPEENRTGTFKRDMLRVDLDVKGIPFTVYTVHLKAQSGGDRADHWRLGEAQEMRQIALREMGRYPSRRYVVTGDFNDTQRSPALQPLLSQDSSDWHLNNALAGKDPAAVNTHPSGRPNRQIDFILYPDEMQGEFKGAEVVDGPRAEEASDHLPVKAQFDLKRTGKPGA